MKFFFENFETSILRRPQSITCLRLGYKNYNISYLRRPMKKRKDKIIMIAKVIVIVVIEVARTIICDRLPKGDVVFWPRKKEKNNGR